MGSIYKRTSWHCLTCNRRVTKTIAEDCRAANHQLEERESSILWISYRRAGKSYAESTESDKIGVAKALLRDREGDIGKGIAVTPQLHRTTFEDGAKMIRNDYTVNGRRSKGNLESRLRLHLEPYFAGMRLADITTDRIDAFTAKRLEAGASVAECNRELAVLNRIFRLAVRARKLAHAPYVPMLQENNTRRGFFEADEIASLSKHLPDWLSPAVQFAFITGWRKSEVLGLQWRQVDFPGGEVRLDPGTTKNLSGRVFPMTVALRQLLQSQRKQHDAMKETGTICPWVFHEQGKQIVEIRKEWKHATKAAGLPGKLFHDLRRSAVRHLDRAGVTRSAAMAMVGHKTESIYRRYSIVDARVLRDAAKKLDATGTK